MLKVEILQNHEKFHDRLLCMLYNAHFAAKEIVYT